MLRQKTIICNCAPNLYIEYLDREHAMGNVSRISLYLVTNWAHISNKQIKKEKVPEKSVCKLSIMSIQFIVQQASSYT